MLEFFIYNLLCKRKRRTVLLLRWNSGKNPPVDGRTLDEIVFNFIDIILHKPVDISIHTDHINLFAARGLDIPLLWLNSDELAQIKELYLNRTEHFKHCSVQSNFVKCFGFKGNVEYRLKNRRELVRDYISLVESRGYSFDCLKAVQKMWLLYKDDRFILELHEILQNRGKLGELLCIN
jgi:hypothetical protein